MARRCGFYDPAADSFSQDASWTFGNLADIGVTLEPDMQWWPRTVLRMDGKVYSKVYN